MRIPSHLLSSPTFSNTKPAVLHVVMHYPTSLSPMPFSSPRLFSNLYFIFYPLPIYPVQYPQPLTLLSISLVVGLQISAYRAPAWIRCAITGRCAWSRTTSQCASVLRLAHKRPTRCAALTATATAVPVKCERWVAPCRGPFTSNTKDPVVSNCTAKQ